MAGEERTRDQTGIESFGNRSLWQIINGTGVVRPKELIAFELNRNKKKILDGLSFYKKPVNEAGALLKDKNLSKFQKDLIQKLSIFLRLDELQSYALIISFLASDYKGSQKELKRLVGNERHIQALVFKIRDYYFTERIYLLHCLKIIVSSWQNIGHPYKDEFEAFMKSSEITEGNLLNKLLDMFKQLTEDFFPSWQTNSVLMTERQAYVWAHQNLREQCEVLEMLMIYSKDFDVSVDTFASLMEMFKKNGFGRRQCYKHVIDDSMEFLVKKIGYLEVLILMCSLDMEMFYQCIQAGNCTNHAVLKDVQSYEKLDKIMQTFGAEESHGPLLLLWSAVRMVYSDNSDMMITKKMGNRALQLNVYQYLYNLLKSEPFQDTTAFVSAVAHYTLYTILVVILSIFDEQTLGRNEEIQVLNRILCQLLKQMSVSEDFWEKGLDSGLGSIYHSALEKFPLVFHTFIQFSTALAESSPESAERIVEIWKRLPRYTEYLDRNSSSDIVSIRDNTQWKLAKNKVPYPGKDFKIDAGTCGQIIGRQGDSPVIQWDVLFNGFDLLLCETEVLLDQISLGAGMVPPVQVAKVTMITEFVHAILSSSPECVEELKLIIDNMYQLIHRFTQMSTPSVELISGCMNCLICIAKIDSEQVWHRLKQTSLLPYLTENVDNLEEVLSGQGLSAGSYGSILAGCECIQGTYPVTTAFLDLVSTLIRPFFKMNREDELMAPVLFILREIFPVFQKWRFYETTKRESIGKVCLEIFHKILTLQSHGKRKTLNRPHLQEVCVYSLLFTEAGRALLEIIATGSDNVEVALAQQGSIADQGSGAEIIKLIQMAFSVLNVLLLLKSPDLPVSPVETSLSSQPVGRQTQHIVSTIAQYIYHRHNPKLPTLACLLLKRLALVSRMSVLACLGGDAESIRNMFLTRLQAVTEDLRLKVVILELLSVCVESQPGLIELFLNVQPSEASTSSTSSGRKDLSLGKRSCLQTVLDLMEADKQEKYMCPPDLLCACMEFIQALWAGLRETAMSVLRAREKFWSSVCAPLKRELPNPRDTETLTQDNLHFKIKTIAFVFRILAQEVYNVTSDKLDEKLKKVLKEVTTADKLKYWSAYVRDCLIIEGENSEIKEDEKSNLGSEFDLIENPTRRLTIGWKDFTITMSRFKVEQLQLTESIKEIIIVDLLEGLQTLVNVGSSPTILNVKLAQITSALMFTLIKLWTSCLSNQPRMIKEIESAITHPLTSSRTLIPSIQIGMLGSVATILQYIRANTSGSTERCAITTVLPTTCEVLLQSTRQLPSPRDVANNSQTSTDLPSADVRLKMQIITCNLLEELLLVSNRVESWLPVLQENLILSTLLSSVELFIKARQGLNYVHSAMLFFLTVAKAEKGAEALALSGMTQHTCLAALSLYEDGDLIPKPQTRLKRQKSSKSPTWHSVYCLCLDLYTDCLSCLKFSFLEDAFHFIGVHQDRMQQCLEMSRRSLQENVLQEAQKTCDFIYQLSHYLRQWRFNLANSVIKLQSTMLYMAQTFIAFLMRPRYLQHVLEQQAGQGQSRTQRTTPQKQQGLQQQSSTEDIDTPSQQLVQVQHRMLQILGRVFSSLRQFTPDICEVLYEQCLDYTEYEPFLAILFTAPSTDQESPPSFGTLTSCVRDVCVRFLTKLEPRGTSPHRSPDSNTSQIPNNLVLYVMENALHIIISQSTRYLRDPAIAQTDKQLLKRELSTEMNYFLNELQRYLRKVNQSSPNPGTCLPSPQITSGASILGCSLSQTAIMSRSQADYFKFVQEFVTAVLK